jgi:TPP-dependent pyruvate/acetoin dehydrogenase alpha subunit
VWDATSHAVSRARAGGGPTVLEAMTHRLDPHIWYDDAAYQPSEELEEHRRQDPLPRIRRLLADRGIKDARVEEAASQARRLVDAAWARVDAARPATWDDTPWAVTA